MGEKRAYKPRKPGGGRKKLKPEYDAGKNLKEQMERAVALYDYEMSLQAIGEELGLNPIKVRKLLITAGVYESDVAEKVQDTFEECRETQDYKTSMQIQNLNALVDTVRHEIIERYRPGEDDPHLKVLQAAHISDDEYFSQMVRDDLNLIIRDIREAHKKDSESAPQTTVANELKENLEAVENFKGSRLEKLAVLYCKQLGINYKNLSDEEFRWLIRILQKSKKTGTPINQRKKR